MGKYSTSISVKNQLYQELEQRRAIGQSFTGIIYQLLKRDQELQEIKNDLNQKHPEIAEQIIPQEDYKKQFLKEYKDTS